MKNKDREILAICKIINACQDLDYEESRRVLEASQIIVLYRRRVARDEVKEDTQ